MRCAVWVAVVLMGVVGGACARPVAAAEGRPRVFLMDGEALERARARVAAGGEKAAVEGLRKEAETALARRVMSVMDKALTPPSGDKHDYMSVGPYWWPDPTKPDGLPYVRKDGEVNPDRKGGDTDATAFGQTQEAIETLAVAWYFTRDERFAAGAAKRLRAWFLDPATRMNPHLKYGQAIPGRTEGRGIGIIDTTPLCGTVDAIGLLGGSAAWTDADQRGMVEWYGAYLDWLRTSKHGRDEDATSNNHGVWFDAQVACYALFAGRPEVAKEVLEATRARRIDAQIAADGRMPHEIARTRSLDYTVFTLRAFFVLGRCGEHAGVDVWSYVGADRAGIRAAVEYVAPYADPARKWPHPQIRPGAPAGLGAVLRRAAVVYREPRFAEIAAKYCAVEDGARERLVE
ncbi:MAG TPA: alginate lyase family protein [Tepidisphaeraceae bacterium]|nr:alginate lyase family protein [Tepidisphaeraceae bacterium]